MGEARRRRLSQDGTEPLTEERVRIGCELALFFMLLFIPRGNEERGNWHYICVSEAQKYPWGGYRSTWWHVLRTLGDPEEGKTLEEEIAEIRKDFDWKLNQYKTVLKDQVESEW
jgi:hypothetical protein